jgi:uncharacterized protein (DUF433 family)
VDIRMPEQENLAQRLYGGLDPREIPRYSLAPASRYLRISPATLRSWVMGRPSIIATRAIRTSTVVDRIDAGESIKDIAADYDLETAEIEEAVLYERAA